MDLSTWVLDRRSPDVFKSLGLTSYQPKVPPVVASIAKDSPAEKAKLQSGDRIAAINGQPIKDWLQIVNLVQKKPNEEIQLTILRDHEARRIPLKVGAMKEDGKAVGYLGILSRPPAVAALFYLSREIHGMERLATCCGTKLASFHLQFNCYGQNGYWQSLHSHIRGANYGISSGG